MAGTLAAALPAALPAGAPAPPRAPRLAAIDWMRGLVMVLMVVDHASMAVDGGHLSRDSALYADAATAPLPAAEFLTRWATHLCAPTFVFLAGTSLALSVERRLLRGAEAWAIDRNILARGAVIALMDPTLISLGSGWWTFSVLTAIGLSMMCMAALRRLPAGVLVALGLGWIALGEVVTGWLWQPPGNPSPPVAFAVAAYSGPGLSIKYPLLPWLAVMALGWALGRHLVRAAAGATRVSGKAVLWAAGAGALAVFAAVRGLSAYGNMFLPRSDGSWQQWLHVSKYPPSLSYLALELGILWLCLALLRTLEPRLGVRENGVFLVFGQTAMFFYLAHRLALEIPATHLGLRGAGDLRGAYALAAVLLLLLYPACRWYRALKAAHPHSLLRYV
jgi:uncharacterized membrane protein